MKAVPAKVSRALQIGSKIKCDDNSGAKVIEIIGVERYTGKRRRLAKAGVGDTIQVTVKRGKPEMKKKVHRAVITRQKKEYRRTDGTRIKFTDNAAVLIDDTGLPKGTEIKGVVAKEAAERFAKLPTIAKNVV